MADYALIGDIGGTNARFALTDLAAEQPGILQERTLDGSDFGSLGEAATHYLDSVHAQPKRAALAVASPVRGDTITLTNRNWSFKHSELQHTLGLDGLMLINDFAAIAWAAPHLAGGDLMPVHGTIATPLEGPVTLIGAGTGLGVALLTGSPAQGWHVVPTEGGHASFAPADDEERLIATWLRRRFGHVSNERVLSGDGLCSVDAALRGIVPVAAPSGQPGLRSAEDITAAATGDNNVDAQHTLDRFCRIYGAVAGDAALLHGANTVLIAGGVVLHFLDFFRTSSFMQGFTTKGRYTGYMERIAVQVIIHENPGLLGAAVAVRAGVA